MFKRLVKYSPSEYLVLYVSKECYMFLKSVKCYMFLWKKTVRKTDHGHQLGSVGSVDSVLQKSTTKAFNCLLKVLKDIITYRYS